ncbi:exodeoxyribonuclease V subunit gamma [Alteromonas sediminis]|uniref:RecBCD enzyme subunit RecC n=1 Tax=Alteromonas sediminis TaxID=2259342 RepID=A0A3N5Y2Z5_9ALTE|nr:exodeoxyribonuclease V subunit gamma [Alteromonas sediminis]RPJ67076.1 exodeoxyribonuclease V subunit gamma [Alteromonas sediminis]
MLTIYPSNRLEHLSALMHAVQVAQPSGVFDADVILVESPGMQHWLQMQLASAQQTPAGAISMNVNFPLTSRFVWEIARSVLGQDAIPEQSPYRREVLQFRILALFQSDAFLTRSEVAPVVTYWQNAHTSHEQTVRRLNLAVALADAFEQYSLFRPDWLACWEAGEDPIGTDTSAWQMQVWRNLVDICGPHPAQLLAKTVEVLSSTDSDALQARLPERIFLFAVNTLAPSLMAFFDALGKHCDIHFFYLNPSQAYWGNVRSDKAIAKSLLRTISGEDEDKGNPLLANLGQQGKDLFNRLVQLESLEIGAFDAPQPSNQSCLLAQIQQDIFMNEPGSLWAKDPDDSINVVSCYTALREVQVLHDHLRKLMISDPDLKARDIVVLCPEIEHYAPYVYSVFSRPSESDGSRLPCSLSDRSVQDADPLVTAFVSLLSLPDSRFSAKELVAYLKQPAISKQFALEENDVALIETWIQAASIRWGLNGTHKASMVDENTTQLSEQNSWEWGLHRLLTGLMGPDQAFFYEYHNKPYLSVPNVEGQQTLVLGKLIRFLVTLHGMATQFRQDYTMPQWVELLRSSADSLFSITAEQEYSWTLITQTLAQLLLHAEQAENSQVFCLAEIKALLMQKLSRPEVKNNFLTGKVTFCSMMPMRSIPFKVVAILGLNDDSFPRKETRSSLNLMHSDSVRQGDRSRSKEDKYLFLEAILSARQYLYLSYQGLSVRDNSERQPSSVVSQFLGILSEQYALELPVHQAPLHSYSPDNFGHLWLSTYEDAFRLAKLLQNPDSIIERQFTPLLPEHEVEDWTVEQVARCFADPLAFFTQYRLGISGFIEGQVLEEFEPFEENALHRFFAFGDALESGFDAIKDRLLLDGHLPDNEVGAHISRQWESGYELLTQAMATHEAPREHVSYQVPFGESVLMMQSHVYGAEHVMVWSGSKSDKRLVHFWLNHLVLNAVKETPISSVAYYVDWSGEPEVRQVTLPLLPSTEAKHILHKVHELLLQFLSYPTLADVRVAEKINKVFDSDTQCFDNSQLHAVFNEAIQGSEMRPGLSSSPYCELFFAAIHTDNLPIPDQSVLSLLIAVYGPLFAQCSDKKVKL